MGRRIGRIVLNGLTALSLLLCVGTVGLWVRSYTTGDVVERLDMWRYEEPGYRPANAFAYKAFTSIDGELRYETQRGRERSMRSRIAQRPFRWTWHEGKSPLLRDPKRMTAFPGVNYESSSISNPPAPAFFESSVVGASFWLLASLFAAAPIIWWVAPILWNLRGPLSPVGLCPRCRYDLTGNVSGVCPECGTPASPAAGAGERAGTPASEGGAAAGA